MEWIATEGAHLLLIFQKLPLTTQTAITLLVVTGLIVHIFKYNEHTIHDGPSIFTTAGILFTFIGIAEGLYDFDAKQIDISLPHLLEGLKTAFIASVFGVGIALSIKLRFALFGLRNRDGAESYEDATVGDLVREIADVQKALVGNEESSVISQLKLARQDTNDRLDELNQSQRQFLQNAAENNSKALIQALQGVIREFNEKIAEQFGENFKQLNEAVGQILEWQERYRSQIQEMIEQQSEAAKNMETASQRYIDLITRAEVFTNISDALSRTLTSLAEQQTQIHASVGSLTELLAKASDGIPKLESKIIQLTEQMTFGVKSHQDQLTNALSEGAKSISDSIGDVRRLVLETTQTANQSINNHMVELAQKMNDQIVKLDAALENELQKSLSSLGGQLTALSQRFVQDYTPLTQRLQEVLAFARTASQ